MCPVAGSDPVPGIPEPVPVPVASERLLRDDVGRLNGWFTIEWVIVDLTTELGDSKLEIQGLAHETRLL